MNLVELPEEILIIIIQYLDFKTNVNIYNTCQRFRDIVQMRNVIKTCTFSLSTIATSRSLKLDLFKHISNHLLELNMCGVPDLTKTSFMPTVRRLKQLETLNVSYTNINLKDFPEIYKECPTIKNISINFIFNKEDIVSPQRMKQYQATFKELRNVHFVGNFDMNNMTIMHTILKDCQLNHLKLSAHEYETVLLRCESSNIPNHSEHVVKFNHFSLYNLIWKNKNIINTHVSPYITHMMNFRENEFVIVYCLQIDTFKVTATPIFANFFREKFNVELEKTVINDWASKYLKSICVLVWNKERTNFDENFFGNLFNQIKDYFPVKIVSAKSEPFTTTTTNWFYTTPAITEREVKPHEKVESNLKKRRTLDKVILNYDKLFEKKKFIELSFIFSPDLRNPITLSSKNGYLKKITFLSLSGFAIYSEEFFNILFASCENLVTLSVTGCAVSPCASPISRYITTSKSLKNFRLLDKMIDFRTLFGALSQCTNLENVNISELAAESSVISNPIEIFEKCKNIYSFVIQNPNNVTQKKNAQILNKARKESGKPYLYVEAHYMGIVPNIGYNYDPFIEFFKVNPIKEMKLQV